MVVLAILIFRNSNALAGAYGIAVTGTMLLTDFLAISTAITIWRWKTWLVIFGGAFFVLMDLVFFTSNTLKFFDGGWFPLGLSVILVVAMTIRYQRYGKQKLRDTLSQTNTVSL
jgi:KUP system potassium uptake protein